MERETLDPRSLISLLNFELAAYAECDGCYFSSIRRMPGHDAGSCNWLDARVESERPLGVEANFIVRHVVEQTRRRYDVAPN